MEVSEVLFSFTKDLMENYFSCFFFSNEEKLENSFMMFGNVGM